MSTRLPIDNGVFLIDLRFMVHSTQTLLRIYTHLLTYTYTHTHTRITETVSRNDEWMFVYLWKIRRGRNVNLNDRFVVVVGLPSEGCRRSWNTWSSSHAGWSPRTATTARSLLRKRRRNRGREMLSTNRNLREMRMWCGFCTSSVQR